MRENLDLERQDKPRKRLDVKAVASLAAVAALAMGTLAGCGQEKNTVEASPEPVEIAQSEPEVVEEVGVSQSEPEVVEEVEIHTPVESDAIINYDLLDGWEELENFDRTKRAYDFFEDNEIYSINFRNIPENGKGQLFADSIQERLDIVYEVMGDTSDPRNQDFSLKMMEYGVLHMEYGTITEDDSAAFSHFGLLDHAKQSANNASVEQPKSPVILGHVTQYSAEGYYGEDGLRRGGSHRADWIESQGKLNGAEVTLETLMFWSDINRSDDQNETGNFPHLIAVNNGPIDMRVQREEPEIIVVP